MKAHRGAADLLAARAQKSRAPVTVTFQVTDRCNYDCVHCYQEHTDKDELSTAEVEGVLVQLADAGVLFLTLMGGEFFMRRDADEILRIAHRMGFAIKLLTTGHHVHDKRADFLATIRPLQVDMSIYGSSHKVHEQVTTHEGSWKRTVAAARRLIARKVPVLLKAPMMESNAADVQNLAAMAAEIGAEFSCDAKITGMENTDQEPVMLRMTAETMADFYRTPHLKAYLAKTFENFDAETGLRPLDHTPCRAGQQSASINPQGQVWPCNALPMPVGDLREQTFDDIWFGSEKLDEIRDMRWAKISECNRCEVRSYCQRCHAMALLEQGEIGGPSLEACRHAVGVRDELREQGLIPETETALPPTWDRVDPDGQHDRLASKGTGVRSRALKVLM